MAIQSDPVAYRVNDFLKAIGLGRTKFYALVKQGKIRTVVLGGRRLVPRSEALRLIGDSGKKASRCELCGMIWSVGSKSRAKAKKLVARVHERIVYARKDHLHKLSFFDPPIALSSPLFLDSLISSTVGFDFLSVICRPLCEAGRVQSASSSFEPTLSLTVRLPRQV